MLRVTGLGFASLLVAAGQQLQVVDQDIPTLQADKSGNASINLNLKNNGEAVDWRPSLSDFEHKPVQDGSAYRLNTTATFDGSTPQDKAKLAGKPALAANDVVEIRITVSQIWEAGESTASFRNAGLAVLDSKGNAVVLHAIRLPAAYNVQFETATPEAVFGPGSLPAVRLVNNDATTYQFDWKLVRQGAPPVAGTRPVTLPANSTVDLDLSSAHLEGSFLRAGTLKDDVQDATLVLDPAFGSSAAIPPQPSKRLPLKVRLRYWSRSAQEIWAFVWTAALLVLGSVVSLWFRLYIPNATGALKLKRQLRDMEEKIRASGDDLSSQWRVLLAWRIESCRRGLRDIPWTFPSFSSKLTELQSNADMYGQWVEIAYAVSVLFAETRTAIQTGVPPTLIGLITEKGEEALAPISTGLTTPDELQSMKTALKTAANHVDALQTGTAIPSLEALIMARETAVGEVIEQLKMDFPQFKSMLEQMKIGKPLKPENYLDRDTFSLKADLLRQYRELQLRACCGAGAPPAGAARSVAAGAEDAPKQAETAMAAPIEETACDRVTRKREKFLAYIAPDAYESLRIAQLFVTEMRQDFYPTPALLDELKKQPPAVEIHANPRQPADVAAAGVKAPIAIEPAVPVRFSLRFERQALNEVVALREWTCFWDFADGTARESGWDVYHQFKEAGRFTVTVSLVDLDGKPVAQGISQNVTVQDESQRHSAKRRMPRWLKLPRPPSPEGRLETTRVGLALAIALAGVFASARGKAENLDVFQAAAAVIALGFSADILKSLLTQKSGEK